MVNFRAKSMAPKAAAAKAAAKTAAVPGGAAAVTSPGDAGSSGPGAAALATEVIEHLLGGAEADEQEGDGSTPGTAGPRAPAADAVRPRAAN